jgi:glutathione peroxidase-family protein
MWEYRLKLTMASVLTGISFILMLCAALSQSSIFDFDLYDLNGNLVNLRENYGQSKALIVVNVASKCGRTYQNYKELVDMHKRLAKRGLDIIAIPSTQFGNQEPGTPQEIESFAKSYGAQFRLMSKVQVNGYSAHPMYTFLKRATDFTDIEWNFVKFLIIPDQPIRRYGAHINPKEMEAEILPYLDEDEEEKERKEREEASKRAAGQKDVQSEEL